MTFVQAAPRTLTKSTQEALLKATGKYSETFRDHMIFSIALGTALRESEIQALNCGDVFNANGQARERIQLRVWKRASKRLTAEEDRKRQVVAVPNILRHKLNKFRRWKIKNKQSVEYDAPLFMSRQKGNRISTRQMRRLVREWQEKIGCDVILNFHALRHTSLTNLQRANKDLSVTCSHARHRSVETTMRYVQPSSEEMVEAVRGLQC